MKDEQMNVLAGGWKALADALYDGALTEATIMISGDRISIEGWAPPPQDGAKNDATITAQVVACGFRTAGRLGEDFPGANPNCDLIRSLLFTNLAEAPDRDNLFLGTHAAELIAGIAAKYFEAKPVAAAAEAPPITEASGFAFQLGSHVVLETSRQAFADRKTADANERAWAESKRGEASPVGKLVGFGGAVEEGEIIARSESTRGPNQYLVRYRSGHGSQVDAWWDEDAIYQPDEDAEFAEVDGEKHRV